VFPQQRASGPPPPGRLNPTIDRAGAYGWRLIAIGIIVWFAVALLDRLRVVVFPVVVATFICVALWGPAHWLQRRGWPALLAVWTVFLGFIAVLTLAALLVVPAIGREFGSLGGTIEEAYGHVEAWIVEDSPIDIDRQRLDELEDQARDALRGSVSSSGGLVVKSAVLVLELVAGALLSLVLTFFFLKDGDKFVAFALRRLPPGRRDLARRLAGRGWATLGGFLRGSALLGTVEAVIIGAALWLSGGGLVAPVMVVTFAAAFVPLVGAVVAGLVAVAVALATSGLTSAVIVGVVALVVQQFDNDLLAPVVFGRMLRIHPVVILLAVAAGGTLAGLAGAFLAVPVTAVVINVVAEARAGSDDGEAWTGPSPLHRSAPN